MVKNLALDREEIYNKLESQVGNTPLYKIRRISVPNNNRIFAKEEFKNPTESTFDRVYPYLFRKAEESGLIVPGITPVIEASTGNAGASFAWCAQELGYPDATLITHADTPKARVQQIESYGAKVVFSPAGEYAAGYVRELERMLTEDKKGKGKLGEDPTRMYCVTKIGAGITPGHRKFVEEVLDECISVDYYIQPVGSGTTISGIGAVFKEKNSHTQVIAGDQEASPVISALDRGEIAEVRPIEMIGMGAAGLPPEKLDINRSVIDEIVLLSNEDYRTGMKLLREYERKEVGRTTGAAFKAALDLSEKVHDKNILILFGDPSWKYTDNYPYLK